jgi:exodeoxyribonuclease V gamma subunit
LLVNPGEYAPLIKSVFAEAGVPIHFPEIPPQQSLEVIAALNSLVEALRGRFELAEGLRLLQQPPITRRFQLEDALADGELGNWLRDAGVRWGRNQEHRVEAQQQPMSGDTWSWAFGLQRLALGAVLPASLNNTCVSLGNNTPHVPLLRAAGLQTATLARLAEFLELFDQHAAIWKRGTTHTLEAWCDAIITLCEVFFDEASQDQALVLTSKVVAPLRKSNLPPHETNTSNAFLQSEISAEVFLRLFNARLDALSEQLMRGDRMSGVLVSDLRKDAALPAQILAVAGLGGEQFPRADIRADWHPLKNASGIGLPSKRGEDRHFLLLAALCPQRRLLLTYVGGSLHDDKPLPPSTPLADLLEAVAKTAGPKTATDIQVNVPLHQFSSAAFLSSLPHFARGQQPAHHQEARILATSQKSDALRFYRAPLPIEPRSVVDVNELKRTLVEPHKIYLARLGLGWFDQPRAFPTGALLGLTSLEKWVLRDWILKERLAAADSARGPSEGDASRELLGLMGKLPQAPRDLKIWEKEAAKAPVVPQEPSRPHPAIQLKIEGVEITGQIDPHWRINGDIATLYTAGASKPKYELRALVDALVLSLVAPEVKVFQIQFSKKKSEDKSLAPKDITHLLSEPEKTLERILELHRLALCVPIPFFMDASEKLKDANVDNESSCLASALEKWKSKDSFSENAKAPEAEALSVQIAFAGIEDPFTEDYKLPEGLTLGDVAKNPAQKLSITLAKLIFGLVPTPSKPDSKSKKALS